MSEKNGNYLVAFVLVVMLSVTAMSILKEPEEPVPLDFNFILDLTDDQAVKSSIIAYLVNRDNEPGEPFKIIPAEPLETDYNITIELGDILEVNAVSKSNETLLSNPRYFTASYIDKSGQETHITGWIDEKRRVEEWDGISIYWITSVRTHPGPHIWIPERYQTNYTGLPEGVDVKIYPESRTIDGDYFKIVFENNRNENLYWGSDWGAEKWIDGEWVEMDFDWAWTAELRFTGPYTKVKNTHKFPFDEGLYRISKKCMLSDVFLRDEHRWRDEFTAFFYLIKAP